MQGKIAVEEHFAFPRRRAKSVRLSGRSLLVGNSRQADRSVRSAPCRNGQVRNRNRGVVAQCQRHPGNSRGRQSGRARAQANDALAEAVAKRPDRFAALAALPMQDREAGAAELQRCVRDLKFKGALVNGFSQVGASDTAVYYDLPQYRPFWAEVEAARRAVLPASALFAAKPAPVPMRAILG